MSAIRLLVLVPGLSVALIGCDGGTEAPEPASCEVAAATCEVAGSADALPVTLSGSTATATDDYGGSTCGASGGGTGGTGGLDVAFRFTAPEAGLYEISTAGSGFDTILSVRDDCGGDELACNDDISRTVTQSSAAIQLMACQTILIVVDGYRASAMGEVVVQITTHESLCGDGLDNDGDGATDCDDDDCFSLECNGGDDWPMSFQTFEWEVLAEINRYRAMGYNCDTEGNFGPAGPLDMDAVIQIAARGHSLDMGEMRFFEHDSPDGRTFADRMSNAGFSGASPWGENIAAGQPTPAEVALAWMESDGHCSNIMNPAFRTTGIGYAFVDGSEFGHYWTQDFAASH